MTNPYTQSQIDVLWPDRGSDCSCGAHRYVGMDDELYCFACDRHHVQEMAKYAAGHQKIDDVQDVTEQQGIVNLMEGK